MNKIIKNSLITIFVAVTLASVGFNVYSFGWEKVQNYYEQIGFNTAVNQIYQTVKQNGSAKIGDMILIPQNNQSDNNKIKK
jgi:hypothetical protein